MSQVDTRLDAAERAKLVQEIQDHLPAFLSSATSEQVSPVADVSELLNLTRRDLERVVAVHVALTGEVRAFVAALSDGLRNPITSSIRPREATQAVRGPIDWAATVKHRATAGVGRAEYVVRPARRVFDTPENRALAYLLERLDAALRRTAPASADERVGVHNENWFNEITGNLARVRAARRHHWLRNIPSSRPDALTRRRLNAARTAFYKLFIQEALAVLHRYSEAPSAADFAELLSQRFFEPERDWQLFEVTLALRLAGAFAAKSVGKRRARLLLGTGRSPYARYLMPDGGEVRLWYQAWPADAGGSVHTAARTQYSIGAGPARPDFVAQLIRDGAAVDSVLVEAKATRHASYLGSGLLQLLGYLKDRPALFQQQPSGWLVAPSSPAFSSVPADGAELWAVTSADVADALVARFGY